MTVALVEEFLTVSDIVPGFDVLGEFDVAT